MQQQHKNSGFQQALETVESLSADEKELLIEIIQKRLQEQRRKELVEIVAEARKDYVQGKVRRGSVADIMAELDRWED